MPKPFRFDQGFCAGKSKRSRNRGKVTPALWNGLEAFAFSVSARVQTREMHNTSHASLIVIRLRPVVLRGRMIPSSQRVGEGGCDLTYYEGFFFGDSVCQVCEHFRVLPRFLSCQLSVPATFEFAERVYYINCVISHAFREYSCETRSSTYVSFQRLPHAFDLPRHSRRGAGDNMVVACHSTFGF